MIGIVDKNLVPMIITFDTRKVEFICESLGTDITKVYKVMEFFTTKEDDDD